MSREHLSAAGWLECCRLGLCRSVKGRGKGKRVISMVEHRKGARIGEAFDMVE